VSSRTVIAVIVAVVITAVVCTAVTWYILSSQHKHVAAPPSGKTTAPPAQHKVVYVSHPELVEVWKTPPLIPRQELIKLGVYFRVWTWWTYFQGYVTVSPDGKYVVVGTVKGQLYVYNATSGKLIREFTFPVGYIPRTIRFTPDGKLMIVGIWSRCGEIIIYDTSTWRKLWSLELCRFVKGPSNATVETIMREPWLAVVPYYAVVSPDGKILYVTIVERYVNPKTQMVKYYYVKFDLAKIYPEIARKYHHYIVGVWTGRYWSRIVAIDLQTHKIVWVWPKNGTAHVDIPILALSSNGKYLAAASFWGVDPENPVKWHMGKVWVIDAATGKVLYTYSPLPPIPYINHTSIWNGLAFADNGKYLIIVTGEGRIVVLNNIESVSKHRPVVLWEKSVVQFIPTQAIMTPISGKGTSKVIKTYIYTYAGLAAVTRDYVIVYTGGTYSVGWTPGYLKRPVMVHPNGTKLFIFDIRTGKLVYVDSFYGMPTYGKVRPFVLTGCYLVGSIGINWVRRDASLAGVYVWYVCGHPYRVIRLLTVQKGLGIPVDVAAHDSYIYVLTGLVNIAPSPTAPAKIVGEYRLIAYRLKYT